MATTVNKTVGELAVEALETYLRKAEGYEKAVIKDRDPEDLHQMRVNLRRLRTAMQVFEPGISLPKEGSEPRVAAIARCLGELRDLDVIIAQLQDQFLPDLPDAERKTLEVIFRYFAKLRQKVYLRVKAALQGDRYTALKSSLHRWTAAPKCSNTASLNIDAVLPDLTLPLLSHLWLHPGWLVGTQSTNGHVKVDTHLNADAADAIVVANSKMLHSLRKQVKRVRYQLKLVADFYGDRLTADLEKLADLQAVLGDLQDSWVIEGFLMKALPNWQERLPTLKALLADSRHRAWKLWQKHQQYYLDFANREAFRQILMQPSAIADGKVATAPKPPGDAKKQPDPAPTKHKGKKVATTNLPEPDATQTDEADVAPANDEANPPADSELEVPAAILTAEEPAPAPAPQKQAKAAPAPKATAHSKPVTPKTTPKATKSTSRRSSKPAKPGKDSGSA